MAPVKVCLGLGSNLGDRQTNLENALRLLAQSTRLLAVSAIYETAPWGGHQQPDFLNCACVTATTLSPPALLRLTQEVERTLGRKPTFRYGPRLIDVDILLYGQRTYHTPTLEIPHPRLPVRAFALAPLAEVAPDVLHPVLKETVASLAARVEGKESLKLWAPPLLPASLLG